MLWVGCAFSVLVPNLQEFPGVMLPDTLRAIKVLVRTDPNMTPRFEVEITVQVLTTWEAYIHHAVISVQCVRVLVSLAALPDARRRILVRPLLAHLACQQPYQ